MKMLKIVAFLVKHESFLYLLKIMFVLISIFQELIRGDGIKVAGLKNHSNISEHRGRRLFGTREFLQTMFIFTHIF